jgi:flagellar basal body-associated protein FliL
MKKHKLNKKQKKKIEIELFDLVMVLILIILIVVVIKFAQKPVVGEAYTTIQTEHMTATVNLPDTIYVDDEFTVNINLDVSGINNGILVTVNLPQGLVVSSVNPSNAVVVEDTIAWTLSPDNHALSFDVISNVAGSYQLKVKFGTYDNYNEISEENSAIVLLNVTQHESPPVNLCEGVICDDNNPCTNDYCVNGNCVFESFDCGPGMHCEPMPGVTPPMPTCMP